MKKFFYFTFALFLLSFISAASFGADKKIAISMPSKDIERWKIDGENLKKGLKQKGYKVSLEFAKNDAVIQNSQIKSFIDGGVDLLIIACVDDLNLSETLSLANKKGVKVIAYDKFIKNFAHTDCYMSFDAYKTGYLQGAIIVRALGLNTQQKGPFYAEIFSSPMSDENSRLYYKGAMDAFSSYIQKERLRFNSGRVSLQATAMKNMSADESRDVMTKLINKFYTSKKLDAVLCSQDIFAVGVIEAVKKAGYKVGDDKKNKPFPIITGQDCRPYNVKAMIDKYQKGSIFKDYRLLVQQTIENADNILNGKNPSINDMNTYKVGAKSIPAYLIEPRIVYKEDLQKEIFDSGYYKKADILKLKSKRVM
ncbi:MAG: sugar-binding protein [Elusimicrobiota bacterium]|jgi:putative multiple sugar transport system substrate-binding protein|nr:sugar-binding protein [Elusimicrobiota bacterium]